MASLKVGVIFWPLHISAGLSDIGKKFGYADTLAHVEQRCLMLGLGGKMTVQAEAGVHL